METAVSLDYRLRVTSSVGSFSFKDVAFGSVASAEYSKPSSPFPLNNLVLSKDEISSKIFKEILVSIMEDNLEAIKKELYQ